MKVKICGITTLDAAQAAIEAGADMLGFNFYPASPRYIAPEDCARIIVDLTACPVCRVPCLGSPVTLVGVFVNSPAQEVTSILDHCALDLAQLSGDEPPEMLNQFGGRAFKAIRPLTGALAEESARRYAPASWGQPALLVDTPHKRLYGGSGQIGDWAMASYLARKYSILLAGGLTPDNLSTAVQQVKPWGVDVASGVESSPGVKDYLKMRAFVQAARQADIVSAQELIVC